MRDLIACDLDGSLLDHRSEISKKNQQVLTYLRNLGHVVVLATGRPFSGAIAKYRQLDLTTALVTDNGGSIQNPSDPGFPRQKTYIPVDVMHRLFINTKAWLSSAFFSVEDVVYAYQYDARLEAIFSGMNSGRVIHGPLSAFAVEPTGMIFLVFSTHSESFEQYIASEFAHTLSYRKWGGDRKHTVYEIYLKHVSKSSALKYLLDYYDIPKERLIAFGDGLNDIEMIRDAHLGVAMLNADPEVKAVAKDITSFSNDEDGIAHYLIKHYQLDVEK